MALLPSDDPAVSSLTVPAGPSRIGMNGGLGLRERPRYLIRMPYSPSDDPWRLEYDLAAPLLPPGTDPLTTLPPGEYFVAQASRPGQPAREIQWGNLVEPARPGEWSFREEPQFHAYGFGPAPGTPIDPSQVLVGVVLLRYSGEGDDHGLWLFNLLPAAEAAPASPIVVIPRSGELVLNASARFSQEQDRHERELWRQRFAWERMLSLIR